MQKLELQLLSQERGVIFLSAPTNSGKTTLIRTIKQNRAGVIVVSAEQVADRIIQQLNDAGWEKPETFFVGCPCVCIEDVDWYHHREYTQSALARVLSRVAERALVIATGIDLKNRVPNLLSALEYDLYEKTDDTSDWKLREQKRVPEIYQNRRRLLRVAVDKKIPAADLHQLVMPMTGKTEEEKEEIAAQILQQLLPEI